MHVDLNTWLSLLSPFVGILLGMLVRTPKDHERAAHLAQIAADVVAFLLAEKPNASYAQLLEWVVAQLRRVGVTGNTAVLTRVATGALAAAGVRKP